jgi:mRNA interferase MazF
MTPTPTLDPKRGEVWLVDFAPSVGAEISKVRPAVVINKDTVGRLPLRVVVPVTDWKPSFAAFSWFVFLPPAAANGLTKDSGADTFQIKSVSLNRFVQRLGELDPT